MTSDHALSADTQNLEGRIVRPADHIERAEAVERAFDYRGDVTLELVSGETVAGYIFNRNRAASPPTLQLFPRDRPGSRVILYADVAAIVFTGEDTASGKSWEAWVHKKASEREAEAEHIKAEAQARGHL